MRRSIDRPALNLLLCKMCVAQAQSSEQINTKACAYREIRKMHYERSLRASRSSDCARTYKCLMKRISTDSAREDLLNDA